VLERLPGFTNMVEKITDIEMRPLEAPVSAKRHSVARQHILMEQRSLKISESVSNGEQIMLKHPSEAKNDDESGDKLKVPFTWRLLEEWKYSPYIKRFFRFVALVNILSLAVNGPAIPLEYLKNDVGYCEDIPAKKIHFIVVLIVDIVLLILYTTLLYIRARNSRHWHKLRMLKVVVIATVLCSLVKYSLYN